MNWLPDDEEDKLAPRFDLEEWTGIQKQQLPPVNLLTDTQVESVLDALKTLLDTYNCSLREHCECVYLEKVFDSFVIEYTTEEIWNEVD